MYQFLIHRQLEAGITFKASARTSGRGGLVDGGGGEQIYAKPRALVGSANTLRARSFSSMESS